MTAKERKTKRDHGDMILDSTQPYTRRVGGSAGGPCVVVTDVPRPVILPWELLSLRFTRVGVLERGHGLCDRLLLRSSDLPQSPG